jgi:peptidoglycan/xylan/chitin deacetylase (PgdA/CDA1 family)/glycosyltransferase involved in cell wall biosynthesis
MVFFDTTGTRKWYVAGGALIALAAVFGYAISAWWALMSAPTEPLISYASHSNDVTYEKTIALTFDDGPDPIYTPEIIELLIEEGVPATFFLVGEQVVKNPETARMIVENGFEIGNHTFSHSEAMALNESRLRAELVATDRVIRDATGLKARLFRPPFLEDVNVGEFDGGKIGGDEARWAENAGFIVVGANLDTQDWNVAPGRADLILSRMQERLDPKRPTVIIMHEHAGKGATIAALRAFIPEMKSQGYRFVPVSEYFGLTRSDVMPPAPLSALDPLIVGAARLMVNGASAFNASILILSILGLARIVVLLASRRLLVPFVTRGVLPLFAQSVVSIPTQYGVLRAAWPGEKHAPVTVLIPAYNEAANIEATVLSVMSGSVIPDQVIVIDDGSTDGTIAIFDRLALDYGERLLVLSRENSGSKAGALNHALPYVKHDIVIAIDADTIIGTDAIRYLAAHFKDAGVGAVAGKVYPASMHSIYAQFQYLEYMQGQNIEKQVFAIGNSIAVVPGALGAWRLSALREAGGYSTDTVVEDQDLTLNFLTRGYRISFEPRAVAYTETPNSASAFFKQRSRWVYGTFQCAWKYRSWLFSRSRPSLGWIVMPNTILFNILMPGLIPIVDGILILGLLGIIDCRTAIAPFLIYTALDMWYAIEGVANERSASLRLISIVVWQRFFYRYLIAAAVYRAIVRAASGDMVGWGSHVRRGDCHGALSEALDTPDSSGLVPSPIRISIPQAASANTA